MPEDFHNLLSKVTGKARRIRAGNRYEMHDASLLPWWNKAKSLHASALVVWRSYGEEATAISAESLGLEVGFSLGAALPPVFCLLSGLSIELLLKAICKGLDLSVEKHHQLSRLAASAGISVKNGDIIILNSMTEYVYWAGRYPTPTSAEDWLNAQEKFDRQRKMSGKLANLQRINSDINLTNYLSLWNAFAKYFWMVHECTSESVEFGEP